MMAEREFMMPVPPEGAAMQFFVEAMKANTAVLERVGKVMEGMQAEQKEVLRLVHDTREKVIKIEGNRVDRRVEELEREVDELKADKDKRDGALSFANALRIWVPILIATIVVCVVVLKANGRI